MFTPRIDPRPDDIVWPQASWPPPDELSGVGVEVLHAGEHLDPSSAAELFAALDDDRCWTHVAGRPDSPQAWFAMLKAAEAAGRWAWVIRLRESTGTRKRGAIVGTTSFLDISVADARLEIGSTTYCPDVWGTSVNPEVKLLLLDWAFGAGFGRVQLKTDIRNHRSQRAIDRLGATYEGVLRRYQRRSDGTVRDTVMFSILAEEWPAVRPRIAERVRLAP